VFDDISEGGVSPDHGDEDGHTLASDPPQFGKRPLALFGINDRDSGPPRQQTALNFFAVNAS
jgi:hypothetical protein